jgi:hypothetical protein
LILTESWSHP